MRCGWNLVVDIGERILPMAGLTEHAAAKTFAPQCAKRATTSGKETFLDDSIRLPVNILLYLVTILRSSINL
jgi:hypothetical protein